MSIDSRLDCKSNLEIPTTSHLSMLTGVIAKKKNTFDHLQKMFTITNFRKTILKL